METERGQWWLEGTLQAKRHTRARPVVISVKEKRLRFALPVWLVAVLATAAGLWSPTLSRVLLELLRSLTG